MFKYYESIPAAFWKWLFLIITVNSIFVLIVRGRIFKELELPTWKGMVPFYDSYLLYEWTWKKEAFWLALAGLGGRFFSWYMFLGCLINGLIRFSDVPDGYTLLLFGIFTVECLFTIVGLAIHYSAMVRLARVFGRGPLFALGLLLCPTVFLVILVCFRVKYLTDEDIEAIKVARELVIENYRTAAINKENTRTEDYCSQTSCANEQVERRCKMDADAIIMYGILAYWQLFLFTRPLLAIARCGILKKAGIGWRKGLIPIYGEYLQYKVSWKTDWYWFHLLSVGGRFVCYIYFAQGVLYQAIHYTHIELMDMVLLALPDIVIALYGLCVRYLAMEHLAKAFGKSKNFSLVLYLLHPIFMLILGYGSGAYIRSENNGIPTTI